jgi:hypothetical protein
MREARIMRVLAALICIALMVCAVSAVAGHADLAVVVLPFSIHRPV